MMRRRQRTSISVLLMLLAGLCVPAGEARQAGARRPETPLSDQARARVRQAVAAVGMVLVRGSADAAPRQRGSAVVVRSDGIVATNFHVIAEDARGARLFPEIHFALADEGQQATEARRFRLRPILLNQAFDLALLRVEANDGEPLGEGMVFPAVEIGDSQRVQLLEDLFIIGYPEKGGASITLNRGVVEGRDLLGQWIKTDARVIHGNSGGAAVNGDGKLIGIPTRVVADSQPIDRNGDGFPDDFRVYGAVGFLRPAHLVRDMLDQLRDGGAGAAAPAEPQVMSQPKTVGVRGVVRAADSGKAVAGALIGLVPQGAATVTEANLLTWGGSDAEGRFVLNRAVPPGRYTLKARALGYETYSRDIEIPAGEEELIIELIAARTR